VDEEDPRPLPVSRFEDRQRELSMDAMYLSIVVAFFALCVGMVRLFERL
jgi:hypothetical protein